METPNAFDAGRNSRPLLTSSTTSLPQVVTGDPQGLKPDLIILNDATKRAVVVDVAIAFDLPQNMDLAS